jgi:hypothetical protein
LGTIPVKEAVRDILCLQKDDQLTYFQGHFAHEWWGFAATSTNLIFMDGVKGD